MWHAVAGPLARRYEVIAPDLPGFGGSPAEDWGVETAADRVAELLTFKPPAVVAGCSMGGYVALALARKYPGLLAGLVLINTRAAADAPEAVATREANIELVSAQGTAALVEKMLPRLLGKTTHATRPEVVRSVRELGLRQSPAAVVAALEAMRDRPDATNDLAKIAVPTLVLIGGEDELIPAEVGEAMAGQIPGAACALIAACGHLAPCEAPDAVAGAILAHFAA